MLYFVSTPIGNLKDITLRALEVLKEVDVIACEDTRHSLKLLSFYQIKKPLVACHKFNERQAGEKLIELLNEGKSVAVITDAGTPVISDPGNELSKMLIENGQEFTVIPGATAFTPALLLSGFDASRFTFIGFLPEKNKDRNTIFNSYKNVDSTLIFYSAPHDLHKNIKYLYDGLGDRRCAVVKEITKIHESVEFINLKDGSKELESKGEYVLIVDGNKNVNNDLLSLSEEEHINFYLNSGYDKKEALKIVAKERGIAKSILYKYTIDK